jgi:chemotaxis protein CheD
MLHIVGLGEMVISTHPGDILKTYALGSCIGVTAYCRKPLVMGMAHIVLPDSALTDQPSAHPAGYFADTAVEALLLKLCGKYGCSLPNIEIKLLGGARTVWDNGDLNIGQRNYRAVIRILDSLGLSYDDSEVGGLCSRTVTLDGTNGAVHVVKYDLNKLLTG